MPPIESSAENKKPDDSQGSSDDGSSQETDDNSVAKFFADRRQNKMNRSMSIAGNLMEFEGNSQELTKEDRENFLFV